jgi:phage terminase large subunit-like protein
MQLSKAALDIGSLNRSDTIKLIQTLEEIERRESRNKLARYYPDAGPLRRELYPKHVAFFAAGATFNERALLGGNRSGKSVAGAFEMVCHMTGAYPHWWTGKKFDDPIMAICSGDTAKTCRDILQRELIGPPGDFSAQGTGLFPADSILRTAVKHGLADAMESVQVRHVSGGTSILSFKSFDQGRPAFQGVSSHVIWLDEEAPMDIYTECLLRTMTTGGIVYLTATPLMGLTELMLSFLPEMQPVAV